MKFGVDCNIMKTGERKHYIDNLRWITLLILIPYHTAQAWNVWGEPNYINFEGNKLISSIIVFFSPYFMPLLFVLAGISTKLALQKRTIREYAIERVKRLFIPFLFGTLAFMPIMTYIGDKYNYSYGGGFFRHYAVFFTKYTDLSGADGGFSVGQFWFLLYLLIISLVSAGALTLLKKAIPKFYKSIPFWLVLVLGLPLPILSNWLSIGGKSLALYTYFFLIGYFVLSDEKTINIAEKYSLLLFGVGITATVLNVYLFIWSDIKYNLLNTITNYISQWIMVIALIGLSKGHLNFNGKVSNYMRARSFQFYTYHFIWVVLSQYLLYRIFGNNTLILFFGTIVIAYFMTFVCCEISSRIPFLCFLTGTKYIPNKL